MITFRLPEGEQTHIKELTCLTHGSTSLRTEFREYWLLCACFEREYILETDEDGGGALFKWED